VPNNLLLDVNHCPHVEVIFLEVDELQVEDQDGPEVDIPAAGVEDSRFLN
jgi:hypothetical protein